LARVKIFVRIFWAADTLYTPSPLPPKAPGCGLFVTIVAAVYVLKNILLPLANLD